MINQLTQDEKNVIVIRVREYNPKANPVYCDWYWDSSMTVSNGILGKFYIPNRIYLPAYAKGEILTDVLYDATICHELTHCKQYRNQGTVLYSLLNITKINEIEAWAEERRVDNLLGLDAYGG
jgi:hypothetical protein